jgi:4-hydroxy-2-oxoheptanedioate aldolase
MIPSPQIVEMVGRLGFDWVLIDLEHGAISLETLQACHISTRT